MSHPQIYKLNFFNRDVLTSDGAVYSIDCHIAIDGNKLPVKASITVEGSRIVSVETNGMFSCMPSN